jgi:hypothetical protein
VVQMVRVLLCKPVSAGLWGGSSSSSSNSSSSSRACTSAGRLPVAAAAAIRQWASAQGNERLLKHLGSRRLRPGHVKVGQERRCDQSGPVVITRYDLIGMQPSEGLRPCMCCIHPSRPLHPTLVYRMMQ